CRTVEAWCGMVARTADFIGIDHVAVGTDRSHNHARADYDWMRNGRWTRGSDGGAGPLNSEGRVPPADWFTAIRHIVLIPGGLKAVGFNDEEIAKITHGNWLRLYADVFGG